MAVPPRSDPRWQRALTAQEPNVSSLATRILLSRLRHQVKSNPRELQDAIRELHEYFTKNPFAARDLPAFAA